MRSTCHLRGVGGRHHEDHAEAALAAQDWAVMNEKRARQSKEVKAGREAESLRSEYGAT